MYKGELFGIFATEDEKYWTEESIITVSKAKAILENANGGDLELDFSSIGGLINVGIEIFLMFRDYKRNNPKAQMILNVKGKSASMASFFQAGEFFDIVTVEDVTEHMRHNPFNGFVGDYIKQRENADYLERLAQTYAQTYSKRSGKSVEDELLDMGKTSYLIGQEIVDSGYADMVIDTGAKIDKTMMIEASKINQKNLMKKINDYSLPIDDSFKKAVARMQEYETHSNNNNQYQQSKQPAMSGKINTEVVVMNVKELQEKHSDLHASVMKAGEEKGFDSGIKKERERVADLTKMKDDENYKKIPECMAVIDKAIVEGIGKDECVTKMNAALVSVLADPANRSRMDANSDSPGDIDGGQDDGSGDIDLDKKVNKW